MNSSFPIVPESETDGWNYSAITDFIDPPGYVIAPDGSRAGLVWDSGTWEPREISPPDEERSGVYRVWFLQPVRTLDDLIVNFRFVLPHLKAIHARVMGHTTRQA